MMCDIINIWDCYFLLQLIPLHLPPGDSSTERNLHVDGTPEQIEIAKQLVNEIISEVCTCTQVSALVMLCYPLLVAKTILWF